MAKKLGRKGFICKGGHWAKRGRKTVCAGGKKVRKSRKHR